MRKQLLLLLLLLSTISLSAGKPQRHTMLKRPNDKLYYITTTKMASQQKERAFEFDITYLTSRKSADIRSSFFAKNYAAVDSVVVVSEGTRYRTDSLTVLYVEKAKKDWETRLSFQLPFDTLKNLYNQATSYQFLIYCSDKVYPYAFPKATWEKEKREIGEILLMISLN